MAKKKQNNATTRRLGTQQQNRYSPALSPDYVSVNEKSYAQNLDFTYRLSELIKLFDQNNSVFGNWQWMLQNDSVFALGSITATELDKIPKEASRAIRTYTKSNDLETKNTAISYLFLYTDQLASNLADWVARFDLVQNDQLGLLDTISEILRTNIGDTIARWQACLHGLSSTLPQSPSVIVGRNLYGDVATVMTILKPILKLPENEPTDSGFNGIDSYFDYLKDLYSRLYRSNIYVKTALDPIMDQAMQQPNHEPHNALLIAFQKLMEPAVSSINTITGRHLDFYYEEVLQMAPLPPEPDQVFLNFQLKKGLETALLPAGTAFLAGKGSEGEDLLYLSDEELVINKVVIPEVLTVTNAGANAKLLGEGQLYANATPDTTAPWSAFGGTKVEGFVEAPVGFVIGDPVLFLSMGERKISLAITLDADAYADLESALQAIADTNSIEDTFKTVLGKSLIVSYTGPKDWVDTTLDQPITLISKSSPAPDSFDLNPNSVGFWLETSLSEDAPAVQDYDSKLHGVGFQTGSPLLRLAIDPSNSSSITLDSVNPPQTIVVYPYNFLRKFVFTQIDLMVSVAGKTDLALQNDATSINPKKAFQILGSAPVLGSNLFIGSPEAFRKQLKSLSITIDWTKLPIDDLGFADYYSIWNQVLSTPTIHNDSFEVNLSLLQKRDWVPLKSSDSATFPLFAWDQKPPAKGTIGGPFSSEFWLLENLTPDDAWIDNALAGGSVRDGKLESQSSFEAIDLSGINSEITQIPADGLTSPFTYDTDQVTGFLKMTLAAPAHGFGSTLFQEANYEVSSENTQNLIAAAKNTDASAPPPTIIAPPALPFVPQAKGISIDYSATSSYQIGQENAGKCYWIQPFGVTTLIGTKPENGVGDLQYTLLPDYEDEGYLYLGLANVQAPQTLTILVQVDENTASTSSNSKPKVVWSYLNQGTWKTFDSTEVIADGTKNFSQSGIVELMLNIGPSEDDAWFNSIKDDSSYLWLRATVADGTEATCQVVLLETQAVTATYQIGPSANTHLATPMPAKTIKKSQNPLPEIGKIIQGFASFGGQVGESSAQFFTRVHERLRHKNRGITQWDIERILLEDFPEIEVANCFNHSSPTSNLHPGNSLVIVFPNGVQKGQINPFEPKFPLSKLLSFQNQLQKLIPFSNKIEIANPTYEELKVQAWVRFMPGLDPGYYLGQLNTDLCAYLAPWTKTLSANPFNTLQSRALIQGFINGLDYIEGITEIEVYQFWEKNGKTLVATPLDDYAYFQPHQLWNILTSAVQHLLFDADSKAPSKPVPLGRVIASEVDAEVPGIGDLGIAEPAIGAVAAGQKEYLIIELKT